MDEYNKLVKFFKIPSNCSWMQTHIFPEDNYHDIALYEIGISKCPPLHSFGPFVRKCFLLHFVLYGKGIYEVYEKHSNSKKKTYTVKKGQAFLIYPNITTFYQADEHNPWQCIWLHFNGTKADDYLLEAGFSKDNHIYTPRTMDAECVKLLCKIMKQPDSMIKTTAYIHMFFNELINTATNYNTLNKKTNYIKTAVNFILKNYWNHIKVTDIANICGINRSYFYRIFKDATARSPQEYLLKVKMDNACDFLKRDELSIADVARSVGYDNQLILSTSYKNKHLTILFFYAIIIE